VADAIEPATRRVLVQPADAHRVVGQPRAAERLEQVEDQLALAEGVEEDRHRAEVEGVRAEPEEMGRDALQLRQDDAHVLGTGRRGDAQERLHRAAPPEVLRNRRHVIEPVGERLDHRVGAMLAELLHAAMQVSDHGPQALDLLAVEMEHQAQHPVRRRVLRTHVDLHLLGAEHQPLPTPVFSISFFQPKPRSGALV
jgi:hypothetical protein